MFAGCQPRVTDAAWKLAIVVVVSVFFLLTLSGTIYGWAALLLVFKDVGVYSELCPDDQVRITIYPLWCHTSRDLCLSTLSHNRVRRFRFALHRTCG